MPIPVCSRLPLARLRWPAVLLTLLLMAGATRPTVWAHSLLIRSQPEANAELTSLPAAVEMWFSEPLESRFSHARLIGAAGEDVLSAGPSVVNPADPTRLSLPLSGLTPGIYTVVWTTLSSVDGHEWIGSFPLTLLNPDGSRPTGGSALLVEGERGELPAPVEAAARWLSLLGAIGLAGSLLFREKVARPLLLQRKAVSLPQSIHWVWRRLALIAFAGILLGGWLQIGSQAAALAAPDRLLELLVNTRPGRLVLLRQLLLIPGVALLVAGESPALFALRREWRGRMRVGVEFLMALGMLATFPFASHAGAVPGRGWAMLGDFVHLLAAAAWMGGLLSLALLFWRMRATTDDEARNGLGRIVRTFSLLAAAAVFLLTVTGLFSGVVQLSTLADLWTTTYGLVLLAKLGLVALALGIAFLNNRMVHGQLAAGLFSPRLIRQVGGEAVVSLGLLLVVALLVQTPPPPRPQPIVAPALPFNDIQLAGDLLVHLQITPNQPGNNRFWTHLYHPDTSPIGEVQLVRLFFAPKRAELGQARADLPTEGNDIFVDEGAWMSQPGEWDVTVYVRRRGMDDATAQFAVTLPPPPGVAALGTPWQNPAATLPLSLLGGGLLLALGAVPFLWWKPVRRRNRDAAPLLGGVGVACTIVGLVLGVQGAVTSQDSPTAPAASSPFSVGNAATPDVAPLSPLPAPTLSLLPAPTLSLLPTPTVSLLPTPAQPGPTATPGPPTSTPAPPATPTPDDVFLAGAEIFQTHCAQCHGPHGMGDGPAATALPVQPAILPFHVPLHADEDVYVFISEGFPNLGMPAFGEILSQAEILQVLRYLRVRFGGAVP